MCHNVFTSDGAPSLFVRFAASFVDMLFELNFYFYFSSLSNSVHAELLDRRLDHGHGEDGAQGLQAGLLPNALLANDVTLATFK